MFDKDAMRFQAKVMAVAKRKLNAKCEGAQAEDFLNEIYREYQEAGKPRDAEAWITDRLRGEFLYVSDPPSWVEVEPTWPFFNGKPMVFVSQTLLPQNEVTTKHLTWDQVVYLFGARVPDPDGYMVEYRTVTQTIGIDGVGIR